MSSLLQRLRAWDRTLSDRLTLPADSPWRWLPALGAHLGDGLVWSLLGGILLVWGNGFVRSITLVALIAVLASGGISTAVKYAIRRRRPQERPQFYAVKYDRFSFPSGHAARMGAIAVIVGRFFPLVAPATYILAVLVAWCRIAVGVHYASDVLAGLALGIVGAWATLLLL